MSALELPVLKLGLAGFSPEQEEAIAAAVTGSRTVHWQVGPMTGADAWFINGLCTQSLGGGRIRIASRHFAGRSVQVQLPDACRPVAFAQPLPPTLDAMCTFDVDDRQSILEVMRMFEVVLAPTAAQFWLAAQIVDQQEVLGSGVFELRAKGNLIAVVDMRGEACVLPSVRPANFDVGVWTRIDRDAMSVPPNFVRASLAELMWRYVSRSTRPLLPERYRQGPIFFRRAPRLDPLLVEEEHLLVMRELAIQALSYDELKANLELGDEELERALAALYYVGSVTANRLRAGSTTVAADLGRRSQAARTTSNYGELRTGLVPLEVSDLRLMTAPAPLAFA